MVGQSKKRLHKITSDLVKLRKKLADPSYIYDLSSHKDEIEINSALALIDNAITRLEYVRAL